MTNSANKNGALGGRLLLRLFLWCVLVPVSVTIIPIVLVGMFIVAARWVIYFIAGLVLMAFALGSKDYVNWFWLAFFIPFFVGGLIDGIAIRIVDRWPASTPA